MKVLFIVVLVVLILGIGCGQRDVQVIQGNPNMENAEVWEYEIVNEVDVLQLSETRWLITVKDNRIEVGYDYSVWAYLPGNDYYIDIGGCSWLSISDKELRLVVDIEVTNWILVIYKKGEGIYEE